MEVAVVGVNFRQASVDMRENFILLQKNFNKMPHVFLTTCNRVEFYFTSTHITLIQEIVMEHLDLSYTFSGEECFFHLARVTAGLDSAIAGESEIQRQVKEAYEAAAKLQKLPAVLHFLFQKSLHIGKMVRTLYAASYGMGEVIRRLVSSSVTPDASILFIGYSEINRQIIHHLLKWGWRNLSLCTKSPASVTIKNIHIFDYQKIDSWVGYLVTIVGVRETKYLLTYPQKEIKTECLIDLGVPRAVDPSLAPFIKKGLWNIDHLTAFQKAEFCFAFDVAPLEVLVLEKVRRHYSAYHEKHASMRNA